jgi:hypothetical protein
MTGKLLLDMGKLTFGSFVLGGVLRGEVPRYILLVTGSVVTAICIFLGLWLSEDKLSEDKKE